MVCDEFLQILFHVEGCLFERFDLFVRRHHVNALCHCVLSSVARRTYSCACIDAIIVEPFLAPPQDDLALPLAVRVCPSCPSPLQPASDEPPRSGSEQSAPRDECRLASDAELREPHRWPERCDHYRKRYIRDGDERCERR